MREVCFCEETHFSFLYPLCLLPTYIWCATSYHLALKPRLCFLLQPVCRGRDTHYLCEKTGEIELVLETEFETYLRKFHVSCIKQPAGFPYFHKICIAL